MRRKLKAELPLLLMLAAMFVAAAVVWGDASEPLPVHLDLSGSPDRMGGRFEALLVVPIVATVTYVLLLVLPEADSRRHRLSFVRAYAIVRFMTLLVFVGVHATTVAQIYARGVPAGRIVTGLFGIFLLGIAISLPRMEMNSTLGIRLPWTLASERVWRQTHRLGAWLLMGFAIATLASSIVSARIAAIVATTGLLITLGACAIFSYLSAHAERRMN